MLLSAPRLDFLYKQHKPMSKRMEYLNTHETDLITNATKALLQAQLIAGQHTLDKERFVDVAKRNGWILQIPEQLLV